MHLLAFDIGGSAVKYGLFSENQLSHQGKFKTPQTFEEMIQQMLAVKEQMPEEVSGIAISAPGAVNEVARRIEGISAVPYIHHRPIYDELEEIFQLPVTIENDANCAGICEMKAGAGRGYQHAAFVVLGTGVGGAVFINGQIYKGANLFAGEFGLMRTSKKQTLSQCGTAVKAAERYAKVTGKKQDGKALFDDSQAGVESAQKILSDMYDNIAEVIYDIQVSLNPEIFIIGGGISARPEVIPNLEKRVQTQLEEEGVGDVMPEIKACEYQNDANLLGAAYNFLTLKG